MGSLIWQLNDCWPGISWSLFDYYGREKAAYYQVKSDFNQVIVASELNDRKLSVKVVSDSTNSFMADLTISLIDFDGNIRWADRIGVNVLSGISKVVYDKDLKNLNRLFEENSSMIVVDLSYEGKSLHRNFHCFTTEKNLILKRPSVSMKRIDLPGNISRFEISVNYFAKNVELSINNETGGFTDNYFDMIPDTKYVIDHYSAEPLKPNEGLNIRSLIDTY
jgi:beta-mannosidase